MVDSESDGDMRGLLEGHTKVRLPYDEPPVFPNGVSRTAAQLNFWGAPEYRIDNPSHEDECITG